jgi:hypothetical protein
MHSCRFARAILNGFFRRKPDAPKLDEWTSCEYPLQFLTMCIFSGSIHRRAFRLAVSASGPEQPDSESGESSALALLPAQGLHHTQHVDTNVLDGTSFNQLVGTRVKCVHDTVFRESVDYNAVLMRLLVTMHEGISHTLFKRASVHYQMPLLADLVNLNYSPGLVPAQLASSVLTTDHPVRILLLYLKASLVPACACH